MNKKNFTAALVIILAGCGGGGGTDTAVSASPPAPGPIGAAPVAEPPAQPPANNPPAAQPPAAGPSTTEPPATAPTPAAPTVSGSLVWAALQQGVSPDPAPANPYTNNRQVFHEDGRAYFLGGALSSHSLGRTPWGPIAIDALVNVSMVGSEGVIYAVKANDLTLEGPPLDLRSVDPALDATAATWTNGPWFASLVVQSVPGNEALMRVCWNSHLPPPPPLTGPPDVPPVVRTVPLKRLMCGVYGRSAASRDVGGYVVDDFDGVVTTYRGAW